MTKSEILQVAKPILFNTEMVRAILDGQKTTTRRLIKPRYRDDEYGFCVCTNKATGEVTVEKMDEDEGTFFHDGNTRYVNPPYKPGQYLYVRETWQYVNDEMTGYVYKATDPDWETTDDWKWRPSIFMPKEAARIFLKVTKVRVERLQEIETDGMLEEGIEFCSANEKAIHDDFIELWNSTIKKQDLDKHGWQGNPWVWVIGFERIEMQ